MERGGEIRTYPWCNLEITLQEMRRNQQRRQRKVSQAGREGKNQEKVLEDKERNFKEKGVITLSCAADKSFKMKTEK